MSVPEYEKMHVPVQRSVFVDPTDCQQFSESQLRHAVVWGTRQSRRVLSSGSNSRLHSSESILSAVTTGINTYCRSDFVSLRRLLTIQCCSRSVDYPPSWLPEILHTALRPYCTLLHGGARKYVYTENHNN
jgi:hypothetical protein